MSGYGHELIKKLNIQTLRETGATALNASLAPNSKFYLHEVRLHLDAVGQAGSFTVDLVSGVDIRYNINIITNDMTADQDVVFQPANPLPFELGDSLSFAWANANSKQYGLEVKYTLG